MKTFRVGRAILVWYGWRFLAWGRLRSDRDRSYMLGPLSVWWFPR